MPRTKKSEVIGTIDAPEVVTTSTADPVKEAKTSNKVETPVEEEKEVSPEEAAKIPAEEVKEGEVNKTYAVYDANGEFVRAYTLEIHGEEARTNAQMVAARIGGSVKS